MLTLLELEVIAPCSFLNANHRTHWAVRHRQTRAWREAADDAAHNHLLNLGAEWPIPIPVRVIVWIHRPHRGRWDPTNYAPTAKAILDGLVDAGVLEDDDVTRVEGPDCRPGKPDRLDTPWGPHPGVRVTFHPTTQENP